MDVFEYYFPVTSYVEFNLDLDKVYKYIKCKYPDMDDDEIYNEFGDNMKLYILELGDMTEEKKKQFQEAYGPEYDSMLDDIWADFEVYLGEK